MVTVSCKTSVLFCIKVEDVGCTSSGIYRLRALWGGDSCTSELSKLRKMVRSRSRRPWAGFLQRLWPLWGLGILSNTGSSDGSSQTKNWHHWISISNFNSNANSYHSSWNVNSNSKFIQILSLSPFKFELRMYLNSNSNFNPIPIQSVYTGTPGQSLFNFNQNLIQIQPKAYQSFNSKFNLRCNVRPKSKFKFEAQITVNF